MLLMMGAIRRERRRKLMLRIFKRIYLALFSRKLTMIIWERRREGKEKSEEKCCLTMEYCIIK